MKLQEGKRYTIAELRRMLSEEIAGSDYPVFGDGVRAANVKNNKAAVKEIEAGIVSTSKAAKAPTGDAANSVDFNKTMLDLETARELTDTEKERIRAAAEGYTSVMDKKRNGSETPNQSSRDLYKAIAKRHDKQAEKEKENRKAGLKTRALKDAEEACSRNSMLKTESVDKMKRLRFSRSTFVNENQMLGMIPEDYITEGNRFVMADQNGRQFMIECVKHPQLGGVQPVAKEIICKEKTQEEISRMNRLYEYSIRGAGRNDTPGRRLAEETHLFEDNFKKVKNLVSESNTECEI